MPELVDCPNCGKLVSSELTTCIHCNVYIFDIKCLSCQEVIPWSMIGKGNLGNLHDCCRCIIQTELTCSLCSSLLANPKERCQNCGHVESWITCNGCGLPIIKGREIYVGGEWLQQGHGDAPDYYDRYKYHVHCAKSRLDEQKIESEKYKEKSIKKKLFIILIIMVVYLVSRLLPSDIGEIYLCITMPILLLYAFIEIFFR